MAAIRRLGVSTLRVTLVRNAEWEHPAEAFRCFNGISVKNLPYEFLSSALRLKFPRRLPGCASPTQGSDRDATSERWFSLPPPRWRIGSSSGSLAVALGAALAALIVRAAIGIVAPGAVPFAPFILAVLVATLLSGYVAGFACMAASLFAAWYFFVPPAFSFAITSRNDAASLILFLIVRETARERRLTRAQEAGAVGDWEWDLATGAITWSDNLYRLMGRRPAAFRPTPENFAAFVHPEDLDRITEILHRAIETGGRFDTEMRGVWPDGTVRHFVSRGDVVRDRSGKPLRITAVKIDITERRRTETALAISEERYRLLFNAMSEAYVVHDIVYDEAGNAVDFRAIEANPAFELHTGMPRDIVVGHLASEFAPGGDPAGLRFFADIVRTGRNAIRRGRSAGSIFAPSRSAAPGSASSSTTSRRASGRRPTAMPPKRGSLRRCKSPRSAPTIMIRRPVR
jgi:PAS domain S-box-containing protein